MRTTIKINNLKDAIPKEGIWYKYYDDIFISVVHHQTPHIRKYSLSESDRKTDNRMSQWHCDWQYQKIEAFYNPIIKRKTYEQSIEYKGETHIIDSLVKNVAIEFQHTLSVTISEIDSRYEAHSNFGKIPYLVLDLTNYPSNILNNDLPLKLKNLLTKFKKSLYFKNNRLFCDFKDCMIRFCKGCKAYRIHLSKDVFVSELLKLEDIYKYEIEKEKKRRYELKIEHERNEKDNNNLEKYSHEDYRYWRFCLKNEILKKQIEKYKFDFIKCISTKYKEGENLIAEFIYESRENNFTLVVNEYRDLNVKYKNGKYKYLRTEYEFIFRDSNYIQKNFTFDKNGLVK